MLAVLAAGYSHLTLRTERPPVSLMIGYLTCRRARLHKASGSTHPLASLRNVALLPDAPFIQRVHLAPKIIIS